MPSPPLTLPLLYCTQPFLQEGLGVITPVSHQPRVRATFRQCFSHPQPSRPLQHCGLCWQLYWCASCPLPLLRFSLSVSTWMALPSHGLCHLQALEFWELLGYRVSHVLTSLALLMASHTPCPPAPTEVGAKSQLDGWLMVT